MRLAPCLLFAAVVSPVQGQTVGSFDYGRREEMIPMRDGVKLFTIIIAPKTSSAPLPFLFLRTPYSATADVGEPFPTEYVRDMAQDGYIFVFQDIRGLYKSEGQFVMNRPWQHGKGVDETTDTYDTVAWLLANVPGNNGRVGALGISYPGWLTEMVGMSGHPAVRAVSPQAPMTDTWMGDDFFHQGAFRQSYGLEYSYSLETSKDGAEFNVGVYDMYDWYLRQGTLARMTDTLGKKLPTWRAFIAHPAYDDFWRARAVQRIWTKTTVPTLTVGGFWDQEDLFGPQAVYRALEGNDQAGINRIVIGPWNHGQWAGGTGEQLGKIDFASATGRYFREKIQAPFFAFYLKDKGPLPLAEATVFEAGSNQWRSYDAWPPKAAVRKGLYLHSGGKLSFDPPGSGAPFTSYVSDPAKPVPYRPRPVQPTYYRFGSTWFTWLVEDQRFVDGRPDVATWVSEVLTSDVTIAGDVTARLFAATTGSDADWVVKLIDVYPDRVATDEKMGGYQLMVSSEIMRGRYRKSFEHAAPITPNAVLDFTVDLHQQAYRFKPGHRIMVQVQSTWFPLYDRNPQTYVPNIFLAQPADFKAATHRIYHTTQYPSRVDVGVMP
ncbi:MAG: CocE/NonD family hydrolase [Gemmatimonadota bacterium]